MYLLWSLVYFPFVLREWLINGFSYFDLLQYIKEFIFKGSYSTIWFLPSIMTAIFVVMVLHNYFSYKAILLIALPFYLFACFGSSYYGVLEQIPFVHEVYEVYFRIFETVKNGILFGFIFVALGAWISEDRKLEYINFRKLIIICTGCYALLAIETVIQSYFKLAAHGVDTKIMLLPLTFFIFLLLLRIELRDEPIYLHMRKLSLLLFSEVFIRSSEKFKLLKVFY